jgi:hypothetical protein
MSRRGTVAGRTGRAGLATGGCPGARRRGPIRVREARRPRCKSPTRAPGGRPMPPLATARPCAPSIALEAPAGMAVGTPVQVRPWPAAAHPAGAPGQAPGWCRRNGRPSRTRPSPARGCRAAHRRAGPRPAGRRLPAVRGRRPRQVHLATASTHPACSRGWARISPSTARRRASGPAHVWPGGRGHGPARAPGLRTRRGELAKDPAPRPVPVAGWAWALRARRSACEEAGAPRAARGDLRRCVCAARMGSVMMRP